MTTELLLNDLLIWNLQIVALLAAAAIFPALIRLRKPSAKLLYWQTALLACLALPLLRPWESPVAATAIRVTHTTVPTPAAPAMQPHASWFTTSHLILWALLLGILVRLCVIAAGFVRLGSYRRHSTPLQPASPWASEAELLVSDEIGSPVTFGFLRPVVLLPTNFSAMPDAARDAILCHEILHVRRKDWLFTLAEEIVRAVFWFHPGIWWTLGEIQLAREQTVDRAVIDMMNSPDEYVDALLTIAGASSVLDVAPAPLFLRKRHLKQRVVSILKEVRMSQRRTVSTLAAGVTLLAVSCWLITAALPLRGAPQTVVDAEGVAVEMNGAQLMHRSSVNYPREAIMKGVEGNVVAQVKTDASGSVVDASILSGPDELRKSVLQSLLAWHFARSAAQSTRQVSISFTLPKDAAAIRQINTNQSAMFVAGAIRPTRVVAANGSVQPQPQSPQPFMIKEINVNGLPDEARDELLRTLPVHAGDTIPLESYGNVVAAVHAFDEHLRVSMNGSSKSDTTLEISAPDATPPPAQPRAVGKPGALRVGGQVQAANLIDQTRPIYPPLAKQARVQGTVRFDVLIAADGTIASLTLISGPPLLVAAAQQAVAQWKYKPTFLNDQPVEVATTVDVNFTLAE